MQPTALAPTAELARPKVRKFAQLLLEELKPARLDDFYSCKPGICNVKDLEGNEWIEGLWGIELLVQSFSGRRWQELNDLSSTISIDDVDVYAHDSTWLKLKFALSARVMRG